MLKRLFLKALAHHRLNQSRRIPYPTLQNRHVARLKTLADRESLLDFLPKNGVVAELGVQSGDFSALILERNQPKVLHLIDLWAGKQGQKHLHYVQERFKTDIESARVILHQGFSSSILQTFPDGYFDWLYIDTDHAYRNTAMELLASAQKTTHKGYIAGHDYVTGNWHGGVRYGVVEAVNEFCVQQDWEFVFLTAETHRHLSFALKKLENISG